MAEMLARIRDVRARAADLQEAIAGGDDEAIDAAVEALAQASDPETPYTTLVEAEALEPESSDPLALAQAEMAITEVLFAGAESVSDNPPAIIESVEARPSISDSFASLDTAEESLRRPPAVREPLVALEAAQPADSAAVGTAADTVLATVADQAIAVAVSIPTAVVSAGLGDKLDSELERLLKGTLKLPGVSRVVRLFHKGVEAAKRAADWLLELLPKAAQAQAKALLAKFESVLVDDAKDKAAAVVFQIDGAKRFVEEHLKSATGQTAKLGSAKSDLEALNETVKQRLGLAKEAASIVGKYGKYLKYVPLAGDKIVACEIALFGLIIAATVYLGRDYTDADEVLQFIPGVRVIVLEAVS